MFGSWSVRMDRSIIEEKCFLGALRASHAVLVLSWADHFVIENSSA